MKKEWYIVTAKCPEQNDVFVKNMYGFDPYYILSMFMQENLPTYAEPNSFYNIRIESDKARNSNREEVIEETLEWCGNGIGWKYVNPKVW